MNYSGDDKPCSDRAIHIRQRVVSLADIRAAIACNVHADTSQNRITVSGIDSAAEAVAHLLGTTS